ncbi:hypothetical protein CVT26_005575 [Gymnopilus dilepis]|uniref:Auxin efflux carrier n=1 Tax=Gymnopilus dilepis TaxID=231916 RepID=A0A409XZP7_9AGAR|nr:hypothetical protein CVT26_005575 [Gymnopilus dilepis]
MVSAATLIWIACRPLLRLMFCVLCGVAITKARIFPAVAAAGTGRLVVNITLPCLMFSKIVSAFTPQNVGSLGHSTAFFNQVLVLKFDPFLGPLILVALLYEAIGISLALLIKQVFWVPHRFRYGILVTGGWGNVGDIRELLRLLESGTRLTLRALATAVVMSLTGAAPFQGANDQNLAVAYISAFVIVSTATLFPLGFHRLVAWDFQGPDVEPEEVQEAMRSKKKALLRPLKLLWVGACHGGDGPGLTKDAGQKIKKREVLHDPPLHHVASTKDSTTAVSSNEVVSAASSQPRTDMSCHCRQNFAGEAQHTAKEDVSTDNKPESLSLSAYKAVKSHRLPPPVHHSSNRSNFIKTTRLHGSKFQLKTMSGFLKTLLNPISIIIFPSFLIAFVPRLKALFIEVPGVYMPNAPDGQPPLAFLLDSTNVVGEATVPVGLMCLGSSLARLDWPKKGEWAKLPLGAISWIAVAKMIIIPILGVLICEGLTNVGLISRDDKVLRFVCIVPAATAQVILTQIYSGNGSSEHLAPFLIPQYILMFISMPAVTAYAIQLLFHSNAL